MNKVLYIKELPFPTANSYKGFNSTTWQEEDPKIDPTGNGSREIHKETFGKIRGNTAKISANWTKKQ